MNCSEYVAHFSDFAEDGLPAERAGALAQHEADCRSCRRYREVFEQGAALLRSLPEPELSEDFGPRLQHRLYHVDEERLLPDATSGTTAVTVLGMALLLTAIAWSPTLRPDTPIVELEPIVVHRPPALPLRPVSAMPAALPLRPRPLPGLNAELWDDAHALLFEYSPLSQRYRRHRTVSGKGLEQQR
jgi:hypothetical protein